MAAAFPSVGRRLLALAVASSLCVLPAPAGAQFRDVAPPAIPTLPSLGDPARPGAPAPGSSLPADQPLPNLPALGDAAGDDLSPGQERRLGEQIMREIRRERSVLDDAELTDFLNRFAQALTATPTASGFEFEFFLVKDPMLNAFALPGGYIGVHTGLIVAAQSESELASVLAHEIGHVTQRHIARMLAQQRQSSMIPLAALLLAVLAARSNPQAVPGIATLGMGVAQSQMLNFSRDAEREADRVGFESLRQAGFDPNGTVSFFTRLQQATRLMESNAPSYLRTHPLTSERIADMQARVSETRYRQRPDSLAFKLARVKLRALTDTSVDGLRNARSTFERQIRDNAGEDAMNWYGVAVAAVAQRDFASADRALAEVHRRLPVGHEFIERLAAESKLAAGNAEEALRIAEAAATRYRDTRALAQVRAEALLAAKAFPRAATFLREQLEVHRSDPQLWRMLAEAENGAGRTALAHRASAEEYALTGGWLAAIEQLRLAQRSGGLDYYTGSQVDARLREIQAEYTRERRERQERGGQ